MKKVVLSFIMVIGFVGHIAAMAEEPSIKVQTVDEQEFIIPLEIAKQIPTLKGLLEDIGEEQEAAIPLPNVNGEVFDWIIKTLVMLKNNPNAQITMQEFLIDKLINLANACEYLELENLQNVVFKELNGRKLSEHSLANMNDVILKKFWQQSSVYSYMLLHKELKIKVSPFDSLVSPDGSKLISWDEFEGAIKIWSLLDRSAYRLEHKFVNGVLISPDGSKLISWSSRIIKVWDLNTRDQLLPDLQHQEMAGVIISPEGDKLISWSNWMLTTIKVWDLNTGEKLLPTLNSPLYVNGVIISPNGSKFISWSGELGIINIWDLNTTTQPRNLELLPYMAGVVISPDGSKFISWSDKKYDKKARIIKVCNLNTGDQLLPDLQHQTITGVIISLDGSKFISWATDSGTIKIWDLNTGIQLFPDLRHQNVSGVIISHDGSKLISWSWQDGAIKIWDLNVGDQLLSVLRHQHVDQVIVNSDGSKLISYGVGIKIWDLNLLNEFNNLNADQIKFMMWLYEHRNVELNLEIPLVLKGVYQLLSDNLKSLLKVKVPIVTLLEFEQELQQGPQQQQPEAQPSMWQRFLRTRWWTSPS